MCKLFLSQPYASTIVKDLKESGLNEDSLKTLCTGWQWHKMYVKSKSAARRNYCRENEAFCLEIAAGYLQEKYEIVKEQVYNDLNHIVQSSSNGRVYQLDHSALPEYVTKSNFTGNAEPYHVLSQSSPLQ